MPVSKQTDVCANDNGDPPLWKTETSMETPTKTTQTRSRADGHANPNHAGEEAMERATTDFGEPWRAHAEIEGNPIGLTRETVEQLAPVLDRLQASFWVLYHQYHKHHWLVEGPQFRDLHLFLEGHYEEVHEHLDAIAERMTALGGIPTSDPVHQAELACFQHEPEGTYRIRHDIAAEGQVAIKLRDAVSLAERLGDHGTKRLLGKNPLQDRGPRPPPRALPRRGLARPRLRAEEGIER